MLKCFHLFRPILDSWPNSSRFTQKTQEIFLKMLMLWLVLKWLFKKFSLFHVTLGIIHFLKITYYILSFLSWKVFIMNIRSDFEKLWYQMYKNERKLTLHICPSTLIFVALFLSCYNLRLKPKASVDLVEAAFFESQSKARKILVTALSKTKSRQKILRQNTVQ